ncbi:MAG: hypothetical protein JSU83_17975 [Deltaproteobacteria bacterium]|nr:MAG: hypothetical protein JSU83_17975 [Deltaproteobacteria bacterium]
MIVLAMRFILLQINRTPISGHFRVCNSAGRYEAAAVPEDFEQAIF